MTIPRPLLFWSAVVGLSVFVLWLLRDALLPFVAAFVLAYLLEPAVRRLGARGVRRGLAVFVVMGAVAVVIALILIIAAPPLLRQLGSFIERLPEYAARLQAVSGEISQWLTSKLQGLQRFGIGAPPAAGQQGGGGLTFGWAATFLTSVLTGGQAVLGVLSIFVIAPAIAFYLLLDWDRMLAAIDRWLPRADADSIRQMAREIDATMGAFVRGQALVCLFLAIWYGGGLLLIGLNFGLLIGLGAGFFSFIPYVGSLVGFAVALAVGVVQFWPDIGSILMVVAVFVTGQFLESYVVTPKLVGEAVGLHPVWIMFALFAFGSLFGFAGLLLAVPLAAALGVLMRHGLRAYLASPLYSTEPTRAEE